MFGLYWLFKYYVLSINLKNKDLISYAILYGPGFLILYLFTKNICKIRLKYHKLSFSEFIKYFIIQTGIGIIILSIGNIILFKLGYYKGLNIKGFNLIYYIQLILIAPFFEEIIFRKYILSKAIIFGKRQGVLITSILFSIVHIVSQGCIEAIYTFMLSIVWCHVILKTNNLKYTFFLHSLSNISLFILPNLCYKYLYLSIMYRIIFYIIIPILMISILKNKIKSKKNYTKSKKNYTKSKKVV
ncbi:CPBP family intramembrane glutamic endopeptidase [Eubacterium multiforme]